jgi:hypothetical protein
MVDLEISGDNMVTPLANRVRTGSRIHVAHAILRFPHLPSIAFTFGANRFLWAGIAARLGQ